VTDRPRLAVLGAGRIARMFHLRVLADLGAEVVAVADPDPEATAAATGRFPGAATHRDWREAVARDDVDAVVVCLPSAMHGDAARAAFAAGHHVYVEKPLGLDLDDAERTTAAWRDADRIGMVGLNFRFQPLVRDARRRVTAGQLGELVAVRTTVSSAPRDLPDWKRDRASGGGALLDLAVHHLDLVPFVLDDPIATVAATCRSVRSVDDTVTLTLTTRVGVPVQILASASTRQSDRLELFGTDQVVTVDRFGSDRVEVTPVQQGGDRRARAEAARAELGRSLRRTTSTFAPSDERSFRAALGAFVRACTTGVAPGPTIADGRAVAAATDAARRSIDAGGVPRPIPPPA
jgi:myo-inositol 2-dehydrogenase / D-chiro-inositol 1-dehydrogenase